MDKFVIVRKRKVGVEETENDVKKKVSMSGSRKFNDYLYLSRVMDEHIAKIASIQVGDAKGLDAMAVRYCTEKKIPFEVFRANWKEHGKAAGPIRNADIIANTTLLLAFPAQDSKGTIDAIKKAKKLGIEVIIYEFDK